MNTLTSFIREHRDEIVQEWLTNAMRLPSAEGRTPPSLRDHDPAVSHPAATVRSVRGSAEQRPPRSRVRALNRAADRTRSRRQGGTRIIERYDDEGGIATTGTAAVEPDVADPARRIARRSLSQRSFSTGRCWPPGSSVQGVHGVPCKTRANAFAAVSEPPRDGQIR